MEEEKLNVPATDEVAKEEVAETPNEAVKPAHDGKRKPRGNNKDKKPFVKKDDGFKDRVVAIKRVSKTVKGGRRMKFTALVVVGDGKGKFGFALAKAAEVPDAVKKAREAAKKVLYNVKLIGTGCTISHEINGKYGACNVYLKPAPEGTGIIAGGPVRAILELAGVKNVCSKVYGSRAPINIIRATTQGLKQLKNYKDVKSLRSSENSDAKAN